MPTPGSTVVRRQLGVRLRRLRNAAGKTERDVEEASLASRTKLWKIETGKALVAAGLHPATGGTGTSACSGDMLLEALVACAGVTLNAVATALGIHLRAATVRAEGDLDFRGTLGVAKDVPVGFERIRLQFELNTDAAEEQLSALLRLTERYCVVYQTLMRPPKIEVSHRVISQ